MCTESRDNISVVLKSNQQLNLRQLKSGLPRSHRAFASQSFLTVTFISPSLQSYTAVMCHLLEERTPMGCFTRIPVRAYSSLFLFTTFFNVFLADGKSKVIKEYSFIADYGFDIYDQKVIYNL